MTTPSDSAPAFELSQVQLGQRDVDPAALEADGVGLWELVGTDRNLNIRAPQEQLDSLPATGWRHVHSAPANQRRGRGETLAAPYPDAPGTWATVYLGEVGDEVFLSTDPGPLRVYLGRAKRRESLQLTWPSGLSARAGTAPELHIVVTNVSAHGWIDQTGEGAYVRAWLLNRQGNRVETSPYFVRTSNDDTTLPDLDPGQSTTLPVHLATPEIEIYPAGEYVLDAMLVQLNLRSQPGTLTLT